MTDNQPDLQTRWFITNYVVAAIDAPDHADQAMEALNRLASMLKIWSTCLAMKQPGK
jgi:hypothetical protein